MTIKPVSRDSILQAMALFDRDLRHSKEWRGWKSNEAHKFAIEHEGAPQSAARNGGSLIAGGDERDER